MISPVTTVDGLRGTIRSTRWSPVLVTPVAASAALLVAHAVGDGAGGAMMEKADISVGSTIALGSSERPPVDFRVVGQAVFPSPGSPGPGTQYEEPSSVADGALLTPAGLERLGIGGQNSNAGFRKLLIQWRPGVDHDAALARLGEGIGSPTVPRPGPEIARLAEVERFPQMVAGFLVALSVVAVVDRPERSASQISRRLAR